MFLRYFAFFGPEFYVEYYDNIVILHQCCRSTLPSVLNSTVSCASCSYARALRLKASGNYYGASAIYHYTLIRVWLS